jgi:hypothetical protein
VNDVDLARKLLKSARHNMVMEGTGPHGAEQFVGDTGLAPRQSLMDGNVSRHGAMENARHDQQIGARRSQTVHLLPSRIANPVCAQFVRKAV